MVWLWLWKGPRDKNNTNLDEGIFKANEDFDTREQRNVIKIIDIRVGELLISGSGMFIDYMPHKMMENPRRVAMRKTRRPIRGVKIAKTKQRRVWGIIPDSHNYECGNQSY